ncbi:MAG: thiamine phosphate synthase [Alphaproteobacteria bacterium]
MFRLCLVTAIGDRPLDDYLHFLQQAVRGGVDWVEWREKNHPHEKINQAIAIKKLLDELGAKFLINDYPDICQKISADGVHLGNDDIAVAEARRIIGNEKIIGVSIDDEADVLRANQNPDINYITIGAVFHTTSKENVKKIWGIDGLSQMVKVSQKPTTAIGGIVLDNLPDVMATGVHGVAAVGALHNSGDVYQTAKKFRAVIDKPAVSS